MLVYLGNQENSLSQMTGGIFLRCACKIQTCDYRQSSWRVAGIARKLAPPLACKMSKLILPHCALPNPAPATKKTVPPWWGFFLGYVVD